MVKLRRTVYHADMSLKDTIVRLCPGAVGAVAALLLLGLALDLPGLRTLPVTDRDEARYAQASKQMVESGDYLRIRFLNEARNKKPAGIYWLQAAAVRVTGVKDAIWPYRLVSVAGALATVLLVYLLARRLFPAAPCLPAAVVACSPLLVIVAHAATTDAVLLAVTCAAQGCLASIYLASRRAAVPPVVSFWGAAMGFWGALGIGILIKGPVAPLIAGLTILALCLHDRQAGWLRRLQPAWGVPLLLVLVVPWLLAIQHATGGAFLRESLGQDFANKMKGAQESHGAPPGAYLAAAGLLLWPLFPLAWRGIGRAWQARRSDPAAAFLLAWLIPSWLVFELAPTKLPHYVLPLYPALVFLALRKAGAADKPASRFWRFTCRIADFIWWVAAVLLVAGPPLAARLLGWQWLPAAFACSVVAGVAALFAWRLRQRPAALAAVAAGFALLYFPLLFASVLPRLDDLWLTRKVAALVAQETRGKPTHILSLGFNEPSVAFVFGTQTRFAASPEAAIQALAQDPEALVLVQDAPAALPQLLPVGEVAWAKLTAAIAVAPKHLNRQAFLDAAARAGVTVREAGFADGLNYSRTKRVRVILYRGAGCRMRGAE